MTGEQAARPEPRTEAGEALLGAKTHVVMDEAWYRLRDAVLAIEAEATAPRSDEGLDANLLAEALLAYGGGHDRSRLVLPLSRRHEIADGITAKYAALVARLRENTDA